MLFHKEGNKYFESEDVKNVSDISIFRLEKDKEGFVDDSIIRSILKLLMMPLLKVTKSFIRQWALQKNR